MALRTLRGGRAGAPQGIAHLDGARAPRFARPSVCVSRARSRSVTRSRQTRASMNLRLVFLGVGAPGSALGNASAALMLGGVPLLQIDCGPDAIHAFVDRYGRLPPALFITHAHLDHIGGLENLFFRHTLDRAQRHRPIPLFTSPTVAALIHRRIADYPMPLSDGARNFWDSFQLILVSSRFHLAPFEFHVFGTRHHEPGTSIGLHLPGHFVYTGDTRPIPELIHSMAGSGEVLFHDGGLTGNASHSGLEDIRREYQPDLVARMTLYHYASEAEGEAIRARGVAAARPHVEYSV
jgi:ribonuclease BN (tRNA processing enzyme)